MSLRCAVVALTLTVAQASSAQTAPSTEPSAVAPFVAHYEADWKTIAVGTSDLELKQSQPGRYVYTWTITARGIFRMLYREQVTQQSWLSVHGEHVRPDKYRAKDGSSTVSIDFDWEANRARGMSEGKPVDLKLKEGIQDLMSIQVEVMLDLKNGKLPKTFEILEKDELKEFNYAQEGAAKIRTEIGELDTLIVSSQRTGSDRILRMWFAPSLGYLPVQAERTRDGKLEFAMRIQTFKR